MTAKPATYPREVVPGVVETRKGAFSIDSDKPKARLWHSLDHDQRALWLSIRKAEGPNQRAVRLPNGKLHFFGYELQLSGPVPGVIKIGDATYAVDCNLMALAWPKWSESQRWAARSKYVQLRRAVEVRTSVGVALSDARGRLVGAKRRGDLKHAEAEERLISILEGDTHDAHRYLVDSHIRANLIDFDLPVYEYVRDAAE